MLNSDITADPTGIMYFFQGPNSSVLSLPRLKYGVFRATSMKKSLLVFGLLICFNGTLAEIAVAADPLLTAPTPVPQSTDTKADNSVGQYELIDPSFTSENPHSLDFDSTQKSVRSFSAATASIARPVTDSTPKFTLIRVAPFSGINPFDHRAVRLAIEAALTPGSGDTPGSGSLCTPGPLSVSGVFPIISFENAYIDIDAAANSMTARDTGSVGSNTALVISKPDTVNTTFTTASGWQSVTPSLPASYLAGSVNFILRHIDSGDYYRVQTSIQPGSMVHLTGAAGTCCGQGGCP